MATDITLDKLTIGSKLTSNVLNSNNILVNGFSIKTIINEIPTFNDKVIVNIGNKRYELYGKKKREQQDNTIEMNGIKFTSFVEALQSMTEGINTMVLLGDCNIDEMDQEGNMLPKLTKSLVVDLNGYSLYDSKVFTYQDGSTTRKILFDFGWEDERDRGLSFELKNGKIVTPDIRLISFNSIEGNVNIHDISGEAELIDNYYINVFNAAHLTVDRCTFDISSKRELIYVDPYTEVASEITVSDITNNILNYTSLGDGGSYHTSVIAVADKGIMHTSGNTITAQGNGQPNNGVYGIITGFNSGATLNIGNDIINVPPICGGAIRVEINNYEEGLTNVVVNGTKVNKPNNDKSNTLFINWNNNALHDNTITVLNGEFYNYKAFAFNPDIGRETPIKDYPTFYIRGGLFDRQITAEDGLDDGYECIQSGNMWLVQPIA